MAQLEGIDISHWQTGLSLAKADQDFAIFKATDGTNFVDATCNGFVSDAKRLGMNWGVYHFAQNTGNMAAEADFFVKHVAGYVGDGLLVLDWEHGNLGNVSGAKAFLDRVYAKTGVRPLIYMSQSVAASYNWDSVQRDYALWVARYGSSIGSTGGWPVTMWQYTSSGHVSGYSASVDKDHFYGSGATWDAFASGESAPSPDPDPDPPDDGDDEMPKWKNTSYDKDYTVAADGEWHVLTIGGDADGIEYTFLTGPVRCSGVLNLSIQGVEPDREVDVRPVVVAAQSGKPTTVVTQFPATEFFTGGASATMQIGIPFTQDVSAGSGGADHRLRFQLRAYGSAGHKVTVTSARARAVYWKD